MEDRGGTCERKAVEKLPASKIPALNASPSATLIIRTRRPSRIRRPLGIADCPPQKPYPDKSLGPPYYFTVVLRGLLGQNQCEPVGQFLEPGDGKTGAVVGNVPKHARSWYGITADSEPRGATKRPARAFSFILTMAWHETGPAPGDGKYTGEELINISPIARMYMIAQPSARCALRHVFKP